MHCRSQLRLANPVSRTGINRSVIDYEEGPPGSSKFPAAQTPRLGPGSPGGAGSYHALGPTDCWTGNASLEVKQPSVTTLLFLLQLLPAGIELVDGVLGSFQLGPGYLQQGCVASDRGVFDS